MSQRNRIEPKPAPAPTWMENENWHSGMGSWWWWGCESDRIRHDQMTEEEQRAETRRICAKVNAEMAERRSKR